MNVLERFRNRQRARKLRRQLPPLLRLYIDKTSARIWQETQDIGVAEAATKRTVDQDAVEMGIDPATILLLVQIAVAIYQALKHLNVLNPTTELVSAIFEGDEDDGLDS